MDMAALKIDFRFEILKIILTAGLIGVFGFFVAMPPPQCADCQIYKGLPLPFEISGGFSGKTEFIAVLFVVDLVFWYLVAWAVLWALAFLWKKYVKR